MAIEEITLSVPASLPDSGRDQSASTEGDVLNFNDRLVQQYRRAVNDRHRFAWTRRGRRKRQQAFESTCRNLVKQLAREVTEPIADRTARQDSRTRLYASLTGMVAVASANQQLARKRGRRMFTWGLLLSGVGVSSLAVALLTAA